jgi:ribonuclease Z
MIKVVILGTAGSAPTRTRHLSSVALIYDGDILMLDCGEGTQFQMLSYGINAVKVKAIFLSHTHGDHIIGIAGLVRTMALNSRKDPLLIFVPEGYEKVVKNLIVFDRAIISYPIIIKGVRSGIVYKGKSYCISAFRLKHTIPTYGYVFKENDKLRFVKSIAERSGVRGRMFSVLQKKGVIKVGNRTLRIGQLTRRQIGKKIVYAIDTRPTKETVLAARNADLLIHEAAFSRAEEKLARERKHSTAAEAAELAKRAHVKMLVLTHISARHKNALVLLKDARKIFRNAVVANDGYSLLI